MKELEEFERRNRMPIPPMPPVKAPKPDHTEVLQMMLEEQRQTNRLLMTLIQALGDEYVLDEDDVPKTYMDGSPV